MASEKPVELAGVSDDAWSELRKKVNSTIFSCPTSYGRTFFFVILWFAIAATVVILSFEAVGPSEYFWEAFWNCQSKHTIYEPYTYEFCAQYSGWGSACMLSFFIILCGGLFGYAYLESRQLKRWRRQVEPMLISICKEQSPLFVRYGYFLEMREWTIIFRNVASDGDGMYSSDADIPREIGVPLTDVV